MYALDDLAAVWWRFHGPNWQSETHSDPDNELTDAADEEVERRSQDVASLVAVVEALVRHAPSGAPIAYIGTWVLEDADAYVGRDGIAQALASLDPDAAEGVASGYIPRSLPPGDTA